MGSILLLLPLMMTPSDTLTQAVLQKLLPTSVHEWNFAEPSRVYTGREIFKYMDGAGEVYLAYGFQRLLVQRYAHPNQEEILVEIFDMGLPRNAYGAFTNMQGRGPAVEIGQNGEYKSGLLTFWKGRHFVCVMIDRENDDAKRAVLEMGAMISEAIKEEGAIPGILQYLPIGEFSPESLRYFFRNEILNIHFYVADKNLFHLGDKTDAVLVRMKSNRSYLMLVQYDRSGNAQAAYEDFSTHYMPEAHGSGIVQTESGKWSACRKERNFLTAVFDAPTQSEAQKLLDTVQRRLR